MALRNGVDLVLELPVCYATGSAEFFAHGAVSLLDKLGVVDALCFGSECGDISLLKEAAQFLLDPLATFDNQLQSFLKDGLTYPAARLKALQHSLAENDIADGQALSKVLTEPNNILGIEYMKAIHRLSSHMVPLTIQRKAAHYHDRNLSAINSTLDTPNLVSQVDYQEQNNITISSATAIRKAIYSRAGVIHDYFTEVEHSVPKDVFTILSKNYLKTYPITEEDFAHIIKYKLQSENKHALTEYLDITSDLADRLKNITDFNHKIADLTGIIKTKNMTLTRINRSLIHLLLNIRTQTFDEYNQNGYARYARVLGIKKESSHLLRKIEKSGRIPIITKVSKAEDQLDVLGMRMLSEDLFATHLYNQAVYEKYGTIILNEYKHGICIV
jgi:predicted nucleotidyltransferase